jgi:chloramphenicol 3-O-phosphotransferase
VHVEGDVFRRFVVSGREEMKPDPSTEALAQLRLRYRLAARVADGYFDAGFTVVWEDVVSEAMLQECVALLRARPVHVFSLVPRPEVIAARDVTRPATGYSDWTIEGLRAGFADTPHSIGVRLDTSTQTPEETVETILAHAAGRR